MRTFHSSGLWTTINCSFETLLHHFSDTSFVYILLLIEINRMSDSEEKDILETIIPSPIEKSKSDDSDSDLKRCDSMGSTASRTPSQRFSLGSLTPYIVPGERVDQLEQRKLLTDVMYDELRNICWLLGIAPRSSPIVDNSSYYARSVLCVPCYVFSRCFTLMTCFISDSFPGKVYTCHLLCFMSYLQLDG